MKAENTENHLATCEPITVEFDSTERRDLVMAMDDALRERASTIALHLSDAAHAAAVKTMVGAFGDYGGQMRAAIERRCSDAAEQINRDAFNVIYRTLAQSVVRTFCESIDQETTR